MLKLWVVGEDTPDPKKWSIWSEYVLVIAADEAEARRIAECDPTESVYKMESVCEIPMDKPLCLVRMAEPSWGDDI